MSNKKLEIGDKFSRLTVVSILEPVVGELPKVLVRCDCGEEKIITCKSLKSGNTKSCGCLRKDKLAEYNNKHGMSRTRFYKIWRHMKERCDDEKSMYFKDYGGRGITYDPRLKDFINFMEDMLESYKDTLELDRINPNGDYCKDNCQWSTESHQAYNQRKRKTNTSGRTGGVSEKER